MTSTMLPDQRSKADEKTAMAAIEKVWREYRRTSEAADLEGFMALWADDGVQMPDGVPQRIGKAAIRVAAKEMFAQFLVKFTALEPQEVRVAGDWAFSRGTYGATFTPRQGGAPMVVDGKFLTIIARQSDGTWKIHCDCFNSNVAPGA